MFGVVVGELSTERKIGGEKTCELYLTKRKWDNLFRNIKWGEETGEWLFVPDRRGSKSVN